MQHEVCRLHPQRSVQHVVLSRGTTVFPRIIQRTAKEQTALSVVRLCLTRAYFAIFHWHRRLAHACCFVDQLAWIARGRPRRKLCVIPNYPLMGFSPSPEKQVRIGLATEVREGPRNMVQTDGVIAYDVAACTKETCCKKSRHLCSYNYGVV